MVIVKRHKDRLTFMDNGETRTGENGFEAVTIYFDNGAERSVNVTGDSCLGIMDDLHEALT